MSIPHPESTKYNPVLLDTLTSPNTSSHYGKRPQGNVVNLLPFPECDSSDDDYSEKEEIVEKINDIRLQKDTPSRTSGSFLFAQSTSQGYGGREAN
jgi:hypothetical protein